MFISLFTDEEIALEVEYLVIDIVEFRVKFVLPSVGRSFHLTPPRVVVSEQP